MGGHEFEDTEELVTHLFPPRADLNDLYQKIFPQGPESLIMSELNKFKGTKQPEQKWYRPLVELLGNIQEKLVVNKESVLGNMAFHVYDKLMGEQGTAAGALKPDIVGLCGPLDQSKPLFWWEVVIPIEVKDDLNGAYSQMLTYMRAVFSSQHRLFVVGLIFSPKDFIISWIVATRAGIHRGKKLKLDDTYTLLSLVQFLDGMRHCNNAWDAGFDPSCNGKSIHVPEVGGGQIINFHCQRETLHGRATEAYEANIEGGPWAQEPVDALYTPGLTPRHITRGALKGSRSGKNTPVNSRGNSRAPSRVRNERSGNNTGEDDAVVDTQGPGQALGANNEGGLDPAIKMKPVIRPQEVATDTSKHMEVPEERLDFMDGTPLRHRHHLHIPGNDRMQKPDWGLVLVKLYWATIPQRGSEPHGETAMYKAAGCVAKSVEDSRTPSNFPFGLPIVVFTGPLPAASTTLMQNLHEGSMAASAERSAGEPKYTPRARHATVLKTIGQPLLDCPGPQALFQAIADAIVGKIVHELHVQ